MPPTSPPAPSDDEMRMRLDFAQRSFINAQELNRFLDQKMGYLIMAVGILTTIIGVLASKLIDMYTTVAWMDTHAIYGVPLLALYCLLATLTVILAAQVLRARDHRVKGCPVSTTHCALGLLYPMIIAEKQYTEQSYLDALLPMTPEALMREYAHQIVIISHIYTIKHRFVNRAFLVGVLAAIVWIIAVTQILPLLLYR